MRATESPAVANRIGNRPQARPSLRLLTSPAWLAADRAGSRKLVRVKICRPVSAACRWSGAVGAAVWVAGFVPGVVAGFADGQGGQAEAERGEGEAEVERRGPQPVAGGEVAGGQRGDGDGAGSRRPR